MITDSRTRRVEHAVEMRRLRPVIIRLSPRRRRRSEGRVVAFYVGALLALSGLIKLVWRN